MKKMILGLALLSLSSFAEVALADSDASSSAAVSIQNNDQSLVEIGGEAARALFNSLNVHAISSFGLIQKLTKSTDKVQCTQAILGDVPGSMSKPSYYCSILVDRK